MLVYAALFGLAFGSFANLAVERLPRGQTLSGRSRCDGCRRALHVWELIPVLSYLLLRGRCATCGDAIGIRTPLLEAGCGLAFVVAFRELAAPAALAASAVFVALGIALAIAWEKRGVRS